MLALPLGGCVAGLVASAAGMAVRSAQGTPQSNAELRSLARAACSERAAGYGTVHVIDVEQRSVDRIVIWGTVDDGTRRQSFECGFKDAIVYFKLRKILPQ